MEKKEFRVVIKHYFLCKKTPKETKEKLDKYYAGSAPSYSTIKYWFRSFQNGCWTTADAERSGRPIEVTTPEIARKMCKIVMEDRKVKVRELAETLSISKDSIWRILHEQLQFKKLIARWVPRLLTFEQKVQRIEASEKCLSLLKRNTNEFFRRYITVDETWIHYYTPESTQQSKQWILPDERTPKRPKTQQSAGKVMATVFWDARGIIFIDFLEKGRTITGLYYTALLDRLSSEIKKKRPHLAKKKVLFHHDNAPSHSSFIAQKKLQELRFEILPHPPYSPDLAPCDFFLFPNFKRWLTGKRFSSNIELECETKAYFEGFPESYFLNGLKKLENRYSKCIELQGNYVE